MKKIIYVVIYIFLMSITTHVKAENYVNLNYINDVYYIIKVDDYYYSYNEPIISLGEKVVYCLEPEKSLSEKNEYEIGNINDLNISIEQLEQIELIGYYGYGFKNHNDYKYYLATQELIWRIMRPNMELSWVTEQYGSNRISVEKEKEEILNYVNRHKNISEIYNTTLKLTLDEEIILDDDFSLFDTVSSEYHDVKLENGKLKIKTSNNYIGKTNIELKKQKEQCNTEIYTLANYQSLIYPSISNDVIVNFEIETIAGQLNIVKIDDSKISNSFKSDATLEGSVYNLYDENLNFIRQFTINQKGEGNTGHLKLGVYYFEEVEASKGYMLNSRLERITISERNLNSVMVLKAQVIQSKLEINKTYGDDYVLEKEAQFIIKDQYGNEETIVTDENGYASSDLVYGKYTVRQIIGIENYYLIDEFEINVADTENIIYNLNSKAMQTSLIIDVKDMITLERIKNDNSFKIYDIKNNNYLNRNNSDIFKTENGILKIDNISVGKYVIEQLSSSYGYKKSENLEIYLKQNDNNLTHIDVYNELILNKIEVIKKGINYYKEEEILNNVKFGIYAKEDIIINNKTYYYKDELIEEIIMNNSIALSKYIPVGYYYVKEIETVNGYKKDNEQYEFEINDDEIVRIELFGEIIENKITINKYGIDYLENTKKLNSVKFGIYAHDDIMVNDKVYFYKDQLIEEIITNDGQATSNYLPIGNYYLKELETIKGYNIDTNEYFFDINEEDNTFDIYNNMVLGTLEVNIISEDGRLLSGVKFGVYANEDIIIDNVVYYQKDELIKEITTNDSTAKLENVLIGNYYIKEIETLPDYKLNDEIYEFEVKNNDLIKIESYSYLKDDEFVIYDVPDTETKKVNKFSIFIMIMLGYIIIKYGKI